MEKDEAVASVKDRLEEAMSAAGMRKADLAAETGLHRSTIGRYLSGEVEPKLKQIQSLAAALQVSWMWLYGYDVPKARTPEQIRNEEKARVIAKLRDDPEFLEVVTMLAKLPAEEYSSVKQILSALVNK